MECENIKFSIIVPVYNVEQYLEECLKSIFCQTYRNYEVICIDDASIDNSCEILKRYQIECNNMKVIFHEKNRGLSAARNSGIKEAAGEYIVFVDSDDMLKQDALMILRKEIQDNSYDIVYYNMSIINEGIYARERKKQVSRCFEYSNSLSGQELFIEFYKNNDLKMESWRQLYKKEFLDKNNLRFYEGILHEDMLFWVQTAIEAKVVKNINRDLYIYRRRDNSIVSTICERQLDSLVIIVSELLGICKSSKLSPKMECTLLQYIRDILDEIKKWCAYYPEHKKLSMGTSTDQFIYSLILNHDMKKYKYIKMSIEKIESLKQEKKIIVYGAGAVGIEVIRCMEENHIKVCGVVVTHKDVNISAIQGYSVKQIEEYIEEKEEVCVIVAVKNTEAQENILFGLRKMGFIKVIIPDFIEY